MKLSIRNVISFFYALILFSFGHVRKARKKAMKGEFILSIYFHRPSKKEFETIILWLKKKDFHFISHNELSVIKDQKKPFPKGAVMVTVDDGWTSNVKNIAEVANKHAVPVTIFITTGAIEEGTFWFSYAKKAKKEGLDFPTSRELKKLRNEERLRVVHQIKTKITLPRETMTIEEVKEIANLDFVSIGAHSHTHPILVQCEEEEMINEIEICKKKLQGWINREVDTFAYPNGDFSNREIQALRKAQYNFGFANNPDILTKEALKDSYRIPRIGFLEGASFAENICRIVGVWHPFTKRVLKKKQNVQENPKSPALLLKGSKVKWLLFKIFCNNQ